MFLWLVSILFCISWIIIKVYKYFKNYHAIYIFLRFRLFFLVSSTALQLLFTFIYFLSLFYADCWLFSNEKLNGCGFYWDLPPEIKVIILENAADMVSEELKWGLEYYPLKYLGSYEKYEYYDDHYFGPYQGEENPYRAGNQVLDRAEEIVVHHTEYRENLLVVLENRDVKSKSLAECFQKLIEVKESKEQYYDEVRAVDNELYQHLAFFDTNYEEYNIFHWTDETDSFDIDKMYDRYQQNSHWTDETDSFGVCHLFEDNSNWTDSSDPVAPDSSSEDTSDWTDHEESYGLERMYYG